jgi:hypothetical protein
MNGGLRKQKRSSELNEEEDEHHILKLINHNEDEPEDIEGQLISQQLVLLRVVSTTSRCYKMKLTLTIFKLLNRQSTSSVIRSVVHESDAKACGGGTVNIWWA